MLLLLLLLERGRAKFLSLHERVLLRDAAWFCVVLRGAAWCCVCAACVLRVCCVGAAWVLRGCCVGAACVLRGCCVIPSVAACE